MHADVSYRWPGLFSYDRLHRVQPDNTNLVALAGLGLADCGAVCTPLSTSMRRDLPLCPRCFPRHWPGTSQGEGLDQRGPNPSP